MRFYEFAARETARGVTVENRIMAPEFFPKNSHDGILLDI